MFTFSIKREIRHFHVVVVQKRQRNVQKTEKSVMHVHHTLTLFIVYFDVLVAVASLDQALATKGMINLG